MSGSPVDADINELSPQERRELLERLLQEKAGKPKVLPTSFAQERLWFLDQLDANSPFYNIPSHIRFTGSLDVAALERSINEIVRRHETLRTSFKTIDNQPTQTIVPTLTLPLPVVDLSNSPPPRRQDEARRLIQEQAWLPFDLSHGPLLRAKLLKLGDSDHVLILIIHHIVSDGWSMGVLIHEVTTLYQAFSQNKPSTLPELSIQYADFAVWQKQWLRGQELKQQLDYWERELTGMPTLALSTDHPRPPVQRFQGAAGAVTLSPALSAGLEALSRQENVTVFMTLLAAFKALLCRYTGQDDLVVGCPIANRNRAEIEPLIGFFVNMLIMRTDTSANPTFRELLSQVRDTTLGAFAHQDLPFERLVEQLQPERDLSRNPLFQVSFALHNTPMPVTEQPGLKISPPAFPGFSTDEFDIGTTNTRFDFEFHLWQTADGLSGTLVYDTALFEAETIERFLEHFRVMLEAIVSDPSLRISQLPLLTDTERDQLKIKWNNTQIEYPCDTCIHELFEQHVKQKPDSIALSFDTQCLTYAQLNTQANQLAHRLIKLGVGHDTKVGICLDRSIEMIIGILGALKAGCAYVPLDPSYPKRRLAYMLADAQLQVLITHKRTTTRLPKYDGQIVCLDNDRELISQERQNNPSGRASACDLAYVIYTSGSTGQPKGVLLEHQGLVNVCKEQIRLFGVGPGSRVLQFSSLSFDASVFEIVMALGSGATLCLGTRDSLLPGPALIRLLNEQRISIVTLPPSALAALPTDPLPHLRTITVAGEACSAELVAQWAPGRQFFNLYGPSETTIWATCQQCTDDARIPTIGRPIANKRVYILDRHLNPVPIGVPGELHVGGVGLARGYLNRPELTEDRFIANPFSSKTNERLYKTGDLTRYLPDGQIEFLGRIDHQVKLRGFRIELGEIEHILDQHTMVRQSVVICREDEPERQQLIAYIVPNHEHLTPNQIHDLPQEDDNAQWDDEFVSQWQTLYEQVYNETPSDSDPAFNITGWNSSYTGEPIPQDHMLEWVNTSVSRIRELNPHRVLEIGCGAGLLLCRIAPECGRYLGCDFSQLAIKQIEQLKKSRPDLSHIELSHRMADDFKELAPRNFDTVVINSVTQYLPNTDYLLKVFQGAVDTLQDGGHLFIGDVRSLPLLSAYHASVQLHRASDDLSIASLKTQIEQHITAEEELAIDPAFFQALVKHFPRIDAAEILVKRGRCHNELTRFRYDVVLHVRSQSQTITKEHWLDWDHDQLTLESIEKRLIDIQSDTLGITHIPNARLSDVNELLERLTQTKTTDTVGQLRQAIKSTNKQGIDPEQLVTLGSTLGYQVGLTHSELGADGRIDVLFSRSESNQPHLLPSYPYKTPPTKPWHTYANNPLIAKFANQLVPKLRSHVTERLPDYMIPSAFVVLDELPISPNGKVDRKALPAPEGNRQIEENYVSPQTQTQRKLVDIWQELLRIDTVGIHDNFFSLGGHSLLAMQAVSRIHDTFGIQLPVANLFGYPTVAGLAEQIDLQRDRQEPADTDRIKPLERTDDLPLSFAQQRLWFLNQLEPDNPCYNMPGAMRLKGPLQTEALRQSFDALTARHEVLRTIFASIDGQPTQKVRPQLAIEIETTSMDPWPPTEWEEQVQRLATEEAQRPFDLTQGPLLRAHLLRLTADEHVLLLTMHHIICDGWSVGVLIRELASLYETHCANTPSVLDPMPIQYADFAAWQRQWLQGTALQEQLDYWKQQLANAPALELPTDRSRPAIQTYRGAHETLLLPRPLVESLEKLSQQQDATLFMTLLAAFNVLLQRYTGQDDLVVGSPIANRNNAQIENLIGFFINMLVMRTDAGGDPTFKELLSRVRDASLQAYAHQDVPFEKLVDELQLDRDLSRNPLFQVMFALQNAPMPPMRLGDLELDLMWVNGKNTRFDLEVHAWEHPDGLDLWFVYNTDLFDQATIGRMLKHFQILLHAIVENPDRRPSQLPLLTDAQQHQVLVEWNDTVTDYPTDACVDELFEQQAEKTPDAVAVSFDDSQLTYAQVNTRANQLAHHLMQRGVGPETMVGLCVERGLDMIVGVLGILKAGGAYVPFDPDYPAHRIAYMLHDAQASVLLTQQQFIGTLPEHEGETVLIDADWSSIQRQSDHNPERRTLANSLAYVMYTSGSTGQPRGVCIEHRAIVGLVKNTNYVQLEPADRIAQASNCSFDASTFEIWGALLNGARIVGVSKDVVLTPQALAETIRGQGITTLFLTTALFNQMAREAPGAFSPLRQLLFGGEAVDPDLVRSVLQNDPPQRLLHVYGPTETTTYATWHLAQRVGERDTTIPIGKPLSNNRLYVLDPYGNPVPTGVCGELHIGGDGLARGYLNQPELTAEKFVADPFCQTPNARMYKTGDLVRYRPDSAIEFVGRRDGQIKLRGFRIELGEIEIALNQHGQVRDAVVLAREDKANQKRIVGYLVPETGRRLDTDEIRARLCQQLPNYMVPAVFVVLDALPLTANGKINRKALPAPEAQPAAEGYVAPRNRAEQTLAGIWAHVLKLDRVSVHDNFFKLGGDSILSMQIIARANQAGLGLKPNQLFQHQTLAALAAVSKPIEHIQAEQGSVVGPVSLTPIHHWFFGKEFKDPHRFNFVTQLDVKKHLPLDQWRQAIAAVTAHHDGLNLCAQKGANGWQETCAAPSKAVPFAFEDLSGQQDDEQLERIGVATREAEQRFCLEKGPLIHFGLYGLGQNQPQRLVIAVHHLVIDGVSLRILLEDLHNALEQLSQGRVLSLPAKTTSFRHWSRRLDEYARSSALEKEMDFWLAGDGPQAPTIPLDDAGGANTVGSELLVRSSLTAQQTRQLLQEAGQAYNTQINDLLLTALALSLAPWVGDDRLLIHLEGHGREAAECGLDQLDLTRTVGWFTSIYPVLLRTRTGGSLGEAIKLIKEQLRAIPRRGVGYGLLRYLHPNQEIGARLRSLPQGQISFNYLGQFDRTFGDSSLFDFHADPIQFSQDEREERPYLVDVSGSIANGRLQMVWIFSRNVYHETTIKKLADRFMGHLQELITHCRTRQATAFTPSDFPDANLDQDQLDELVEELDEAQGNRVL